MLTKRYFMVVVRILILPFSLLLIFSFVTSFLHMLCPLIDLVVYSHTKVTWIAGSYMLVLSLGHENHPK